MPPNPDTGESTEFFPAFGPGGKWLRCTATVMRDTSGAVTGVMETLEDVTGQKQREFQVRSGS
jgi:PAS domain-containing protein